MSLGSAAELIAEAPSGYHTMLLQVLRWLITLRNPSGWPTTWFEVLEPFSLEPLQGESARVFFDSTSPLKLKAPGMIGGQHWSPLVAEVHSPQGGVLTSAPVFYETFV